MQKDNLYETNKIRVFTGTYIDPLNPQLEDIHIEDIAHGLSMQCRFGGHTKVFYSVAQHCVEVAMQLPDELRLAALLHDASEAYLLDIPRPVKGRLTNYKTIEKKLMSVIAKRFGFDNWDRPEIKEIDRLIMYVVWDNFVLCLHPIADAWGPLVARR